MAREHADELLARLANRCDWPPTSEAAAWTELALYRAFREADADYLKRAAKWDHGQNRERDYLVDPLPSLISATFAGLIFGEDPELIAAEKSDQERLAHLADANDLPSEVQEAAETVVSEGEVWWRILVDTDQADTAIIDWHSRLAVIPLIRGRTVLAAAFVQTLEKPRSDDQTVYRALFVYADEVVHNTLWKGNDQHLGDRVALTERDETADLPDAWDHGLEMLAGRVQNRIGKHGRKRGVSDYQAVKTLLMALNEVTTIGRENARLTLKQRAIFPDKYLDALGRVPAGAEVLIASTVDQDPEKAAKEVQLVEWSFDAQAFIAYHDHLSRVILGRVRLAKQLVDADNPGAEGRATGTALRLRLLPTTIAAQGKARAWDDALPKILCLAQQVDALPEAQGGLGQAWTRPADPPAVERTPELPEDETEEATRHSVLVTAEIESRQTAIEELHPDWSKERVQEELQRIRDDVATLASSPLEDPTMHGGPNGQPVPDVTASGGAIGAE